MAVPARKLIVFDKHGRCYKTLRPIGTWGDGSRSFVYEAVVADTPPPEGRPYNDDDLEHVTLKLVHKRDEVNFESAKKDIHRLDSLLRMERYEKLPYILRYQSIFSNESYMGILLPSQVHSLRSLMSTRPGLKEGMPQELIAEALRRVLACLSQIHKCKDYHRQITAGSIFYSPQLRQFQLAYAISVYDCYQPGDENVPRCPINSLLDWAKAPEEDQTWLLPASQFTYTPIGSRIGSDIWMVGITALELAYGKIEVADRNQLLSIAAYICKKRKLPNTWQELRAKAESAAGGASSSAAGGASSSAAAAAASSAASSSSAAAAASSSSASDYPMTKPNNKINSIKKHVAEFFSYNKRFSKSFARFVARCLDEDLTRRYTAVKLLEKGFLTKYRISPEKMVALITH